MSSGSDTWMIDSGSSNHMTVPLGDDYQYPIKGIGEATYKLDSGMPMKMKDVLYVPGLKKKLLHISSLDKKGLWVSFKHGEFVMCHRGKSLEDASVIGTEEGGMYKLKGHSEAALIHYTTSPCEK